MSDPRDDRELVSAYIDSQDPNLFGEIVSRHSDRVFSICMRIAGNRADALDASQEVFLRLLRKIHLYDGTAAFTTWLHRVASNVCYDQLRSRSRAPLPVEEVPEIPDMSDIASMDAIELKPMIDEALSLIPYDYRAPVVLRDMEGMSYDEIQEVLDIPAGTVRSRIHRGRRMLADLLRNLTEGGERQNDAGRDERDGERRSEQKESN